MKPNHWVAAFLLALAGSSVHAACSDLSRPECVQGQLEEEDRAINAIYARLMEKANLSAGEEMRAAQRKWLRDRNATCNLAPGSTNRSDWIATLAQEPGKGLCVYGSTHARLEQLRNQSTAGVQIQEEVIERREIGFPISHDAGKWYAEATFLAKNYAQDDGQYMQVAVSNSKMLLGMQLFRSQMSRLAGADGNYVVGVALDLDNGKMYWSDNGTWHDSPGSAGGIPLTRGDPYALRIVSAGSSISKDLNLGFISFNTGQTPFVHPTPAGYKPYFATPANVAGGPQLDWIVPPYKKVAGLSLPEWAERYWAWLLPKSPARSPTQDTTGEFCADDQSGPVWYLAGGDTKSRIERTCRVPKGKFIGLPVFAQGIFPNAGTDLCAKFANGVAAKDGSDSIQNAYIAIDGTRFDALYDFHVYTPHCTPIRGSAGEIVVADAVFYAVLVMLQPLPEGEHVISFGGDLAAMNTYRNVTYKIIVN